MPPRLSIKLQVFPTGIAPLRSTYPSSARKPKVGLLICHGGGWRRLFTRAPLINNRADHILDTTTFQKALAERRCVVPATNFYEWQVIDAKTMQPFSIGLKDAPVFAMAGLWEDETHDGFTERCHLVCTIEPNKLMLSIHDRQPPLLNNQEQVVCCKPPMTPR